MKPNKSDKPGRFLLPGLEALSAALKKAAVMAPVVLLAATASYGGFFSSEKDLPAIMEEVEASGADRGSVEELERYAGKNPEAEGTDEALFRLGAIFFNRKDFAKSNRYYQALLERFPASRFKFDALYELGNLRFRTGAVKDARTFLETVSSSREATAEARARARLLLKQIEAATTEAPGADAPAIGALLPLKGGYSQFGEEALDGVLLAADVFGGKGSVEVIVKNVGSDPSAIEAAVDDLASNERVAGIVGPLVSSTSLDAVRYAQKKRMPVITLSQRDGITQAGDYVFRNSLTPSAQAAAIAEYAVKRLGKRSFAVLYPQNNYGVELAKLFEKEVRDQGGTVQKAISYPQGTKDFSEQVKHIFGIQVKERKEGRRKIKEYTPTVAVEALFVPDFYDSVALMAPYLEYYNIRGIQLLGANGWNSGRLIQLAGKNVEGAVFVDGFFPSSVRPGTDEFSRRFREVYGRDPGVLEAQAYDSARFLIAASSEGGAMTTDREALRGRLRAFKGFRGASGAMSFDEKGEAVKRLFILTVRDGRIIEAEGQGG